VVKALGGSGGTPKGEDWERFMGGVAVGLDMDYAAITIVLLVVHGFLMVWCFTILQNRVDLGLLSLDSKIAGAIKSVIQEGLSPAEPVNPVQMAIASMLTRSVQQTPGVVEIVRDAEGKFSG